MSPEYTNWHEVPNGKKETLQDYVNQANFSPRHLRRLFSKGFAFTQNAEGAVGKFVENLDLLTENTIRDARKMSSGWNVVLGANQSKRGTKRRESFDRMSIALGSENAPLRKLSRNEGKPHRGKHRSVNKGPALRAFFRSARYVKSRRNLK